MVSEREKAFAAVVWCLLSGYLEAYVDNVDIYKTNGSLNSTYCEMGTENISNIVLEVQMSQFVRVAFVAQPRNANIGYC